MREIVPKRQNPCSFSLIQNQGTTKVTFYFAHSTKQSIGVQFLRRFRQHLNPQQVYDLMRAGPLPGLNVFKRLENFQVLICGGDGSISWVLSEMDRLGLTPKVRIFFDNFY